MRRCFVPFFVCVICLCKIIIFQVKRSHFHKVFVSLLEIICFVAFGLTEVGPWRTLLSTGIFALSCTNKQNHRSLQAYLIDRMHFSLSKNHLLDVAVAKRLDFAQIMHEWNEHNSLKLIIFLVRMIFTHPELTSRWCLSPIKKYFFKHYWSGSEPSSLGKWFICAVMPIR